MDLLGSNPMPKMPFKLSKVELCDVESIVRHVEVPAMQNGPLFRTMFPTITEAQKGEIIRWSADIFEDAFEDQWESFLKAYAIDGTPVGFCAWTIIERNREHQVEANASQAKERSKGEKRKATWLSEAIDIVPGPLCQEP
jgi:hypothetical protein